MTLADIHDKLKKLYISHKEIKKLPLLDMFNNLVEISQDFNIFFEKPWTFGKALKQFEKVSPTGRDLLALYSAQNEYNDATRYAHIPNEVWEETKASIEKFTYDPELEYLGGIHQGLLDYLNWYIEEFTEQFINTREYQTTPDKVWLWRHGTHFLEYNNPVMALMQHDTWNDSPIAYFEYLSSTIYAIKKNYNLTNSAQLNKEKAEHKIWVEKIHKILTHLEKICPPHANLNAFIKSEIGVAPKTFKRIIQSGTIPRSNTKTTINDLITKYSL